MREIGLASALIMVVVVFFYAGVLQLNASMYYLLMIRTIYALLLCVPVLVQAVMHFCSYVNSIRFEQ